MKGIGDKSFNVNAHDPLWRFDGPQGPRLQRLLGRRRVHQVEACFEDVELLRELQAAVAGSETLSQAEDAVERILDVRHTFGTRLLYGTVRVVAKRLYQRLEATG